MMVLVTDKDENNINIVGINRISPFTLISNVCCILVWMVQKLFVNGKVMKSIPICKQHVLQYIQTPNSPSKTYKNLQTDAIKHAFHVIKHSSWAIKLDWTADGASMYVKFTTKWFDICG